jgi:hypothetical protein
MWGGHPDDAGVSPRRGWSFSTAWFYSHYKGVGMDFSYKYGDAAPQWVSAYRNFEPQAGRRYFLTVETWPELDATGHHAGYRQRMKWWPEGQPAPQEWLELADTGGAPLPAGEYAVALIAHRCQVDFGPVVVKPL